jgi:hypothetical protein
MEKDIRFIALYLPQFHPIPENDEWWGKGFTEWTNVGKARPLFKGHYQPKVPAHLGYYDLRLPETRQAQVDLAKEYGIEGFCYWHYWFGNGKRLLERPFNEVLLSGKPNFPFCLAWANTSWQGFDYGAKGRNLLIKQEYPGKEDYERHFYELLPAFTDKRYITVDGMPFFMLFQPEQLPDAKSFIDLWQNLAIKNGLKGIFFVAQTDKLDKIQDFLSMNFNAVNTIRMFNCFKQGRSPFQKLYQKYIGHTRIFDYGKALEFWTGPEDKQINCFPTVYPNWDHTPRTGKNGSVLHNSTPELFEKHVKQVVQEVVDKPSERKIIMIKSWNEWAEGNYLEPDLRFGLGYLQALKNALAK